jgi:hypothetical protein
MLASLSGDANTKQARNAGLFVSTIFRTGDRPNGRTDFVTNAGDATDGGSDDDGSDDDGDSPPR